MELLRLLPAGAVAGWGLHPLEKRRLLHGARQQPTLFDQFKKRGYRRRGPLPPGIQQTGGLQTHPLRVAL